MIKISRIICLVFASGILLSAPFLIPSLFPLSWVAFAPFIWAVFGAGSLRGALVMGWLAGFVTRLLGFHWLVYTIHVFGGFPYPISALIFVIYAALQGLQMALFAVLLMRFGLGPFNLFPALFWVAIEFWFPLLFPWYLANSQSAFTGLIQSADLVGPYGTSFLVMWCNSILAANRVGTSVLVDGATLTLRQPIGLGHKLARRAIATEEPILKYGARIGSAIVPIAAGDHVHVHNVKSDYIPTHTLEDEQRFVGGRGA